MVKPREVLERRSLAPRKSYGQCFLQDPNVVMKIARACVPDDEIDRAHVVEFGPGTGALTLQLFPRAKTITAIELDRHLVEVLRELFRSPDGDPPGKKVTIVSGDAQTAPIEFAGRPAVLCGNIPYQITGRLIRRAVEVADRIDRCVFMVQREVCDRLLAKPGSKEYGALTVFSSAAFAIDKITNVGRSAFYPQPRVTSAVVRFVPLLDRVPETETFRALVKGAFEQRRKTLRNAWSNIASKEKLSIAAEKVGVSLDARGETLGVRDFSRMAGALDNG